MKIASAEEARHLIMKENKKLLEYQEVYVTESGDIYASPSDEVKKTLATEKHFCVKGAEIKKATKTSKQE